MDRWQQIKDILHEASVLPPAERDTYIRSAASGDPELIAEVESLLVSFDAADDFLEEPPLPLTAPGDSLAGRTIGGYRIDSLIAKGGMGSVYRATRQMDGASLTVAFKIIRFSGTHHYLSRRFRMERQILARLTHENIVRLLDGGVTPDGLPYLVTEYVDGQGLESWLRDTQPTLSMKLRVFQSLCEALAYAHRNLIVHGDIKPGNILIARDGTPKVLDFGIARLLEPNDDSPTSQNTITMTPALTPWWASPEQLSGEPLSMESDTYALGRILFFLLTGEKPHDFTGLTPPQIVEKLRREPPARPSTLTGDARIRGDLDNITLKALEFEKSQRYRSVDALNDDIARHLALRPITARAQTPAYRLQKFIRRNRGLVSLGATATLALTLSLGFALYQAGQARSSYENSRLRFEQLRSLANTLLFEADDALATLPGATPVRARLVKSALGYLDQLARQDTTDPRLKEELAAAYEKIGDIQGRPGVTNLGQTAESLASYRKSESIREHVRQTARTPADFVTASDNLARIYGRISAALRATHDTDGALAYERKSLGIRQALFESDPHNLAFKRALASSLTSLSGSLSQLGDFTGVMETRKEALKMFEEIVAASPASPADLRGLSLALARMGSIEMHEGRMKESFEHYRRALDIDSRLLRQDPSNVQFQISKAWSENNLSVILNRSGRPAEALEHSNLAIPILEEVSRSDSADSRTRTLLETARVRKAQALVQLGRAREALPLVEQALRGRETLAGQNRSNAGATGEVAESHAALGLVHAALGSRSKAISHFTTARTIFLDLIRAERSNAAIREDLAGVDKALRELGVSPPPASAPAASSQ